MKKYILPLSLLLISAKVYAQKTGIGTTNPSEALDVVGRIKLSQLGNYNSSTAVPLVWDSGNNIISMGGTATEKPFNTMRYVVSTASNQDWVRNFDTKIPSNQYLVIITSGQFQKTSGSSYIRNATVTSSNPGDPAGSTVHATPFLNVGAFDQDGTWRLQADYKDAAPGVNGTDYYWTFDLLIINKNQIISISQQTGAVNISGNGSAASSPLP